MKVVFCLFFFITFNLYGKEFDHEHVQFSAILKNSTYQKDGQTWVDYSQIKKSYRPQLKNYLNSLSSVSKNQYQNFNKDERLAFLINAYNAFTIEWIIQHYPVKSIKDISKFFLNPWKQKIAGYKLFGDEFTLDNIEHDQIRVQFNEPRIHFAVNCASIGCPSLRQSAYTAKMLDKELSEAEEAFFKNPKKFRVSGQKIYINPIFDWYRDDFKKKFGSLDFYIAERAEFYGIAKGLPKKYLSIIFLEYDWSLNGK